MNLGTAQVIRGDARSLPLADNSVDLVVTSPPYFALRSYQDGGEHYAGQIGSEPTPAEFVAALVEVTAECVRVLKPSGSLWVNLGDKYATGATPGTQSANTTMTGGAHKGVSNVVSRKIADGVRAKSLIGIPWRYALACIDQLGLILRAEVIWSKPNGLPESVTDRVRRSHEQWFYFEQDSGSVEPVAEGLPFCPQCGRPVDARSTLVQRLKEADGGVVSGDLSDQVRPDESVESDCTGRSDLDVGGVASGAPIPVLVEGDIAGIEDGAQLHEDRVVAVEDEDSEMRVPVRCAGQPHRSLTIEDASEPREFCDCVRHPLIVNDEPWIPQSLAAELMQMVADGEADPQSVADFLSGDYARTHSTWFHFTLSPRYFSAVDEIREAHATPLHRPGSVAGNPDRGERPEDLARVWGSALGKLPGSVWTVPTEPLRVPDHLGIDHFAAFPTEWPRRIIQGWSPAGVCVECGEGRRPVAEAQRPPLDLAWRERQGNERDGTNGLGGSSLGTPAHLRERIVTGYACACPEPTADTTSGVILDPFGGTGTTALVAKALGRHGITVDMSADYCRLAEWRTNDRDSLAKVLGVARVGPADDDQLDLFAEESA